MCFSATASFAAAGTLGAAGVFTLRQAKMGTWAPLAAIPLLFGIQQAVEGLVWLSFGRPQLHAAAALAFVLFSHVFWPIYLPIAIWLVEPDVRRKNVLLFLAGLGAAVGLTLFSFIIRGPITAQVAGHCIDYEVSVPGVPFGFVAYLLATCLSCFVSTRRFLKIFGFALCASLLIAYWSYREALYSVWCFFAAALSLIIYVHLRREAHAKKSTGA